MFLGFLCLLAVLGLVYFDIQSQFDIIRDDILKLNLELDSKASVASVDALSERVTAVDTRVTAVNTRVDSVISLIGTVNGSVACLNSKVRKDSPFFLGHSISELYCTQPWIFTSFLGDYDNSSTEDGCSCHDRNAKFNSCRCE